MLELRPSCEHCNVALPPNAVDARICSYECTFCARCVDTVLKANVCPNCGGGFVPRPVRPLNDWHNGNCLTSDPASTTVKYRPVDMHAYAELVLKVSGLLPEQR